MLRFGIKMSNASLSVTIVLESLSKEEEVQVSSLVHESPIDS